MPPFNIKEFLIIILDGEVCLANSKLNKLILAEDKFNEELEDKILSLSGQDYADEPDQEISLSLKQEMSLGGNKPKMEIESAPDIHKEEILEIVRDTHSGLFYKIENHLNILSLSSHFLDWKEKGKNFFSFYSFLKEESSLSSLLALAAFFEHKENFKTLILCSDLEYVEKFGSGFLKDSLVDAVEISSMIHVGNIYDFISSSNSEVIEAEVDVLKDDYDLILFLYPRKVEEFLMNESIKILCLNSDNINYFFNPKGTKRKSFLEMRKHFKKIGLEEGGIIMGDGHD